MADWLPIPDVYCGWIPFAVKAALENAAGADWILSTSPPESAHLAAWYLARKTGKPWVADFRDPWVRFISRNYPTHLHKLWQLRLERLVLERADLVLATTTAAGEHFRRRYPQLDSEKIRVIPNGFDAREFSGFKKSSAPKGPVKIVYTGNITLYRDPLPFFQALARVNEKRVECTLDIVGHCDRWVKQRVQELGIAHLVTFSGFLPRNQVLKKLAQAHLGLSIESFRPGIELLVPGKLYDYLGAGLPVLAVVPRGAASEIIERTGCGMVASCLESREIEKALRKMLQNIRRGYKPSPDHLEEISRYERSRLVGELAELLEKFA